MLVVEIQTLTAGLNSISHWNIDWLVLAQQLSSNPDILADIQRAWSNFIQTGQVWALLIGLVVGYLFRSFTSF